MKLKFGIFVWGLLGAVLLVNGGTTAFGTEMPGKYVEMAVENNLALKQQHLALEESLQALKEAKGMFLPSLSIEARYSRAGGGRTIEFPVGDLVNPMHTTLNQLMTAHGLPAAYPANVANETIPFLRKKEHDTKLRLVQPLFQPKIFFNYKIKKELNSIEKTKIAAFKRQLKADLETAYFNHLKTLKIKELLTSTRALLEENLKLNRSLFKNDKRTEEVVFRAEAELSKLDSREAEVDKSIRMSASYFNFLLNRSFDSAIDVPTSSTLSPKPLFREYRLDQLVASALSHREEFRQVAGAVKAAGYEAKMYGASILPTVTGVLDYGFQGETYKFSGKEDYWMGSVVVSWNLYRGGQDRAARKRALARRMKMATARMELEGKIRLQVEEAYFNLRVARKAVVSAADVLKSRKETFHIISKKYEQGMVPQIEYMKARTDFTDAGITNIVARYDYKIKEANLIKISALTEPDTK